MDDLRKIVNLEETYLRTRNEGAALRDDFIVRTYQLEVMYPPRLPLRTRALSVGDIYLLVFLIECSG